MRKRNIYRNSISRITRSAVVLAAALPALLLPSGCERENLLKELAGDEAVMRFSVSESVPELLTKSAGNGKQKLAQPEQPAAHEENVIVLTSADGRTLRLIAEEEPLTSSRPASAEATAAAQGPATKAAAVYGSGDATPLGGASIGVWAYNFASPNSAFSDWRLDSGTPSGPVEATQSGTLWKPTPDIEYHSDGHLSYTSTRWFALAPYGAMSGTSPAVSGMTASDKYMSATYTVPTAVDKQWDLLSAVTEHRPIDETGAVALSFEHVLTGVRFKRDANLNVSRIVVSGVYDQAKLDMSKRVVTTASPVIVRPVSWFTNVDGTSAPDATKDLWSNRTKLGSSYELTLAAGDWTNGNPKDDTKEKQYDYAAKDANILMMIPQLTPQGAKITVTIDGEPFEGDISGHRWLPGRLVTYRIDKQMFFQVKLSGHSNYPRHTSTLNEISVNDYASGGLIFTVKTNAEYTVKRSESNISVSVTGTGGTSSTSSITERTVTVGIPSNSEVRDADKLRNPDPEFDPGLQVENLKPIKIRVDNNDRYVYFSPGNLQYRASASTWRFARRQWEFIGGGSFSSPGVLRGGMVPESDNERIHQTYSGWIDLFGWGTSGYTGWQANEYGSERYPWSVSIVSTDYGPQGRDKQGNIYATGNLYGGNGDWGATSRNSLNATSGTNYAWYTLPKHNIMSPSYQGGISLFGAPKTYTITFEPVDDPSAGVTFTVVQPPQPTVAGTFILPEGFDMTLLPDRSYLGYNNGKLVTREEWLAMQEAGCVFLPAAGYRSHGADPRNIPPGTTMTKYFYGGINITANDADGRYWTSSGAKNTSNDFIPNEAACFSVFSLIEQGSGIATTGKSVGQSVRLVRSAL